MLSVLLLNMFVNDLDVFLRDKTHALAHGGTFSHLLLV